jgi:hypothetical protein
MNRSHGSEFSGSFLQHVFAPAADVNGGAEFEKAPRHSFAQARTTTRDEDALIAQKIWLEHG